ncbi:hypothetical protein V4P56_04840 [Bartonella sp. B35(2025)]
MIISSAYPKHRDFRYSRNSNAFCRMIEIIQDEIDDTTSEYSVQIRDSIFTALHLCKRESFFFNEKKIITFKTQRGKTWYGKQEGLFIEPDMVFDSVFLGTHASRQTQLVYKSIEVLQKQYGYQPSQGIPIFYTCKNQQIGLFPTPQDIDDVHLFYEIGHFSEENVIPDDNPWMIYAFDLIKARAKYELYKNILKDHEYASVAFNDFQEQLKALRTETSCRKGVSNILSTRF